MKRILLIIAVALALVPLLKTTASGSLLSSIGPVVSRDHGLHVDLWSDRNQDEVYYPGEDVDVYFRANDDCYVTIYSIGSDGDVELLFPRYPDDGYVFGGMTYRLPEYYDDWSYRIDGPTGVEYLHAVASRTPRPFRYGVRRGHYDAGIDPIHGDPFIAMNAINARIIHSSHIHATATLSFFIGSRVWYPRYMCYDCHGRSARFDPYAVDCPRYTVHPAHDYDYWWAHEYHPVLRRFVFGGPFWRFEHRAVPAHRHKNYRYVDCALGYRNYHPVRVISRPPAMVRYNSPTITIRRGYQDSYKRITYSETRTLPRTGETRVRTSGNTRSIDRDPGSARSRSQSTTVTAPSARSRGESTTVAAPSARSRGESTTVTAPSARSRGESTPVTAPSARSRGESTTVTAPSARSRGESRTMDAPAVRSVSPGRSDSGPANVPRQGGSADRESRSASRGSGRTR